MPIRKFIPTESQLSLKTIQFRIVLIQTVESGRGKSVFL